MSNDEVPLNIKHKQVFLNSFGGKDNYETKKIDTINSYLEKESSNNKNESWNKLDKTGKIKLLNIYVDSIIETHHLTANEVDELKTPRCVREFWTKQAETVATKGVSGPFQGPAVNCSDAGPDLEGCEREGNGVDLKC